MSLIKSAIGFAFSLWPPEEGEDPGRWHKAVSVSLSLVLIIGSFHFVTAHFGISFFNMAPVARADQVAAQIESQVKPLKDALEANQTTADAILRALYLPQIRSKVAERCAADAGTQAREDINVELTRLLNEYQTLAGKSFGRIPACNEV